MAERVRAIRPDVPLAVVPMGVPLPPRVPPGGGPRPAGPRPRRVYRRLGGPSQSLQAAERGPTRLQGAGHAGAPRPLPAGRQPVAQLQCGRMIGMLGLDAQVQVVGYAPPDAVCRLPGRLRCLRQPALPDRGRDLGGAAAHHGRGLPVLVSDTGAFTELPDAAVGKVDIGGIEEEVLLEYLLLLARRPAVRAAMGRAARRYVAGEHTLEGAARGYLTFLATLTGQPVDLSACPCPAPPPDDLPPDSTIPFSSPNQPPTPTPNPPPPTARPPRCPLPCWPTPRPSWVWPPTIRY